MAGEMAAAAAAAAAEEAEEAEEAGVEVRGIVT